jgi:hypothetical protein
MRILIIERLKLEDHELTLDVLVTLSTSKQFRFWCLSYHQVELLVYSRQLVWVVI